MDAGKTSELLRLLSTDLTELADTIDASIDAETDENVRGLWYDVSETMNSVFAIMASDDEYDERFEQLVEKELSEHPQLSREEAEQLVSQRMTGSESSEDENDEGEED